MQPNTYLVLKHVSDALKDPETNFPNRVDFISQMAILEEIGGLVSARHDASTHLTTRVRFDSVARYAISHLLVLFMEEMVQPFKSARIATLLEISPDSLCSWVDVMHMIESLDAFLLCNEIDNSQGTGCCIGKLSRKKRAQYRDIERIGRLKGAVEKGVVVVYRSYGLEWWRQFSEALSTRAIYTASV